MLTLAAATMVAGGASDQGGGGNFQVRLTIFDYKGIPTTRQAGIKGAVESACRNLAQPYEA